MLLPFDEALDLRNGLLGCRSSDRLGRQGPGQRLGSARLARLHHHLLLTEHALQPLLGSGFLERLAVGALGLGAGRRRHWRWQRLRWRRGLLQRLLRIGDGRTQQALAEAGRDRRSRPGRHRAPSAHRGRAG